MSLSKNDIKFLKALQQKKYRDQEKLFVVEGVKLVKELLRSKMYKVKHVYHLPEFLSEIPTGVSRTEIGTSDLQRISGLKSPNQVLATVKYLQEDALDNSGGCTIMLDEISDPGNLGTIVRTAEWFGATQVICSTHSVDKHNPKVVQSSMGAIFRMPVVYMDLSEAIVQLKGQQILGADMKGTNAFALDYQEDCVIIMGSESHGLSEEIGLQVERVNIPKYGQSESLNVAMAAGILLAQYRK